MRTPTDPQSLDLPAGETHRVTNQPPMVSQVLLYDHDRLLTNAYQQLGGQSSELLSEFGQLCGEGHQLALGEQANRQRPELHSHTGYGQRQDLVEYHPAYHQLYQVSRRYGLHSLPWQDTDTTLQRGVLFYLQSQVEAGHTCPITMTFAAIPTLRRQSDVTTPWLGKLLNRDYDPSNRPFFDKTALSVGMAMTEKQGGSDVRSNQTSAHPLSKAGPGELYQLYGHKYFVSAPMSDGFLTLAQTKQGLGCFLLPRWRPDGQKNPLQIIRLKHKMGNVANASAETELRHAHGWLIGEPHRGIATILDMVALTRLDCMLGTAGTMRMGLSQALHHCHYREAFGKRLCHQPLMMAVLADLAVESEASTLLALRLAQVLQDQDNKSPLLRMGTALGKYWICKQAAGFFAEAMECIGGSGTMETHMMARLYRDAPINAIWEGSGNIQCLDLVRMLSGSTAPLQALLNELNKAQGLDPRLDQQIAQITAWQDVPADQWPVAQLRQRMQQLSEAWQGALLLQYSPTMVAEAFCQQRFQQGSGRLYGSLQSPLLADIIQRAYLPLSN